MMNSGLVDSSKYLLPGIKYFCSRVKIIKIRPPSVARVCLLKSAHVVQSSFARTSYYNAMRGDMTEKAYNVCK